MERSIPAPPSGGLHSSACGSIAHLWWPTEDVNKRAKLSAGCCDAIKKCLSCLSASTRNRRSYCRNNSSCLRSSGCYCAPCLETKRKFVDSRVVVSSPCAANRPSSLMPSRRRCCAAHCVWTTARRHATRPSSYPSSLPNVPDQPRGDRFQQSRWIGSAGRRERPAPRRRAPRPIVAHRVRARRGHRECLHPQRHRACPAGAGRWHA